MEKKYQVKLKIEIATPLHVNAEHAQDAIDKAHELFCAMDDLELLDAVQEASTSTRHGWIPGRSSQIRRSNR